VSGSVRRGAAALSSQVRRQLGPTPRWSLLALAIGVTVVWCGKSAYSEASAARLQLVLAPTARLVEWISGGDFVYEAGAGWVSRHHTFIIAPVCAGVNFALAAWAAFLAGALPRFASLRSVVVRLACYAVAAYVATVLVNGARISLAIALHRGALSLDGLTAAELHRAEGIAVYLVGLCALYTVAQAVERRWARGPDLAPSVSVAAGAR
jgi:exosortase K